MLRRQERWICVSKKRSQLLRLHHRRTWKCDFLCFLAVVVQSTVRSLVGLGGWAAWVCKCTKLRNVHINVGKREGSAFPSLWSREVMTGLWKGIYYGVGTTWRKLVVEVIFGPWRGGILMRETLFGVISRIPVTQNWFRRRKICCDMHVLNKFCVVRDKWIVIKNDSFYQKNCRFSSKIMWKFPLHPKKPFFQVPDVFYVYA